MHNGWVTIVRGEDEQVSRQLPHRPEVLKRTRPLALRYYLGSAHYRSNIEYHEGSLARGGGGGRADRDVPAAGCADGRAGRCRADRSRTAFAAAMDDDLNVSGALAVLHDTVRAGNTALDEDDVDGRASAWDAVLRMTDVLGHQPARPALGGGRRPDTRATDALDALVEAELEERQAARARRDFVAADAHPGPAGRGRRSRSRTRRPVPRWASRPPE